MMTAAHLHVTVGPWADRGACKGHGRLFFPDQDHRGQRRGDWRRTTRALAICATCPVRTDCLAHALEHDERGIWGGTTENDRRRLTGRAPR